MDTSEIYIKMCEKAEEIQEQSPDLIPLTWIAAIPQYGYSDNNVFASIEDKIIWLPRQDQLQGMFEYSSVHKMLDGFYGLVCTNTQEDVDYYQQFTTMEQLWLAFVMKEKYNNKVWNGTDWVNETTECRTD